MKVGDLVRHSMYAAHMPAAVVLKIRYNYDKRRRSQRMPQILIFDNFLDDVYWDRMCEYEVVSESR